MQIKWDVQSASVVGVWGALYTLLLTVNNNIVCIINDIVSTSCTFIDVLNVMILQRRKKANAA